MASRVHESHGERDAQRVFRKFGLTLAVPICNLSIPATPESSPTTLPVLKVSEYLQLLLRRHSKLLFSGAQFGKDSQALCTSFWTEYRQFHSDHAVYESFAKEDWGNIIPLCLHGDKGRTKVKQPIFNFSFESVFGLPSEIRKKSDLRKSQDEGHMAQTCGERARAQLVPDACLDYTMCPKRRKLNSGDAVLQTPHNGKGHTFLSRFLITAIPSKAYKNHPNLISEFLKVLKDDMCLAFEGLQPFQGGPVVRAALVGIKGDFEFHLEVGEFSRSYRNVGSKNELPFCPECLAGTPGIPGFEFHSQPKWLASCYSSNPWSTPPLLSQIPFGKTQQAALYRRDAFHTIKFGFLKDVAAGVIVWLAELQFFDAPGDSVSLESRLERAFSRFKMWQLAASKTCSLRKFSKANLHKETAKHYAFLGGKGSDSVVCCMFLEVYLKLCIQETREHKELLEAMLETIQGALTYMGIYSSHPLFLPKCCAQLLLISGKRLLHGYGYLASKCMSQNRCLFKLRPKVHYFHHFLVDLERELLKGKPTLLNYAAIFNCEANEDWIGRISRISRRVSPRLPTQRTIERYLTSCRLLFKRAGV